MRLVVKKKILDHLGLVTEAQDEVTVPPVRVILHDVPQDGQPTDRDHWFWDVIGHIADAGAVASAENDGFQLMFLVIRLRVFGKEFGRQKPQSLL